MEPQLVYGKKTMSKEVILSDVVASYFPEGIKKMFGLPEDGLFFFGESESGASSEAYGSGKYLGKYLLLLHKPDITGINLSFKDSKSRWVSSEHHAFMALKKSYSQQLYCSYPLLVVRLTSEYMRADKPMHYMNLLRYADHAAFRKRGIATEVFNSVSERLKEDGIRYLYMDARFKLPSTSKWLSKTEVPEKDLEYISTLFFDKPEEDVFKWSNTFLRIL